MGNPDTWERIIRRRIDPDDFAIRFGISSDLFIQGFDAIVPVTPSDHQFVEQDMAARKLALIPSDAVRSILDDKLAFGNWMLTHDYDTYVPRRYSRVNDMFPIISKACQGHSGDDVKFIQTSEMAKQEEQFLEREDVILEEYLPGSDEYCAHFVIAEDRVWFQKTVRHVMGSEGCVKGRRCFPKRSVILKRPDPHAQVFAQILERLGYRGMACVDYKVVEGVPKIMEINSRIGVSALPVINSILDAYVAALGLRDDRSPFAIWLLDKKRNVKRRSRRWFGFPPLPPDSAL